MAKPSCTQADGLFLTPAQEKAQWGALDSQGPPTHPRVRVPRQDRQAPVRFQIRQVCREILLQLNEFFSPFSDRKAAQAGAFHHRIPLQHGR